MSDTKPSTPRQAVEPLIVPAMQKRGGFNSGPPSCQRPPPPPAMKRRRSSDFPDEAVRHLAYQTSCNCQSNAVQVEQNMHWPSCMVGRAQAFLGRPVTLKGSEASDAR